MTELYERVVIFCKKHLPEMISESVWVKLMIGVNILSDVFMCR